ncbi:MAG: hypothetical protein GY702_18720 [Desulfobulbaceae bacterium]|nr:hypothetical protein [Desulfobulbaceae bacterium]
MNPSLIFCCQSHPELGGNINGPCVIRVPEWIDDAPGKYLMYFGHHQGEYIRLAYADSPLGKWSLYEGGCLHLKDVNCIKDHIASPEAVIVEEEREIRLYFHGYRQNTTINPRKISEGQVTYCARSSDGIHFQAEETKLGPYYMRVFRQENTWYGIAKNHYDGNVLLRSEDGLSPFESGQKLLPRSRHVGIQRDSEGRLWVYFSRIGDKPERILKSELIIHGTWTDWHCEDTIEVKTPEYDWEGTDCPRLNSKNGVVHGRAWQLRDPYVFSDLSEKNYLYYSIAGESGLAVIELEK